ncbi:hypothetical protein [Streptomyces sp. MK37H]|uniref:hypothetical protein n=1 Tax=Streptomyces sp. MK37H TaxID=2699117 RepID=UPI001B359F58|nr:hypothetical protein [Streptomyces sp. MK37H]MBP8539238.1 hypothetical protein [Streptomyces sp. MK37H]
MAMTRWDFTLILNRQLTPAEADALDTSDELLFATGAVSYTTGGPGTSELDCDIEADNVIKAVTYTTRALRRIVPDLKPVAARHDDTVTLGEAALRCTRSRQNLVQLSKGQRGPGGFPPPVTTTGGTALYSWAQIADYLRALGDDISAVSWDLATVDLALRLAAAQKKVDQAAIGELLQALDHSDAA